LVGKQTQFVEHGMIADIAYHGDATHNPHAHVLLTTRHIESDGFEKKNREWNKRELLKEQRAAWASHTNRALEDAGYEERIDHRTLSEQSINRIPQIHIGRAAIEMERRGISTEMGDRAQKIDAMNRELERMNSEAREDAETGKSLLRTEQASEQILKPKERKRDFGLEL
jgi:hypothetical protein